MSFEVLNAFRAVALSTSDSPETSEEMDCKEAMDKYMDRAVARHILEVYTGDTDVLFLPKRIALRQKTCFI